MRLLRICDKKSFLAFRGSDVAFIMLINNKMPTMVGILTFMNMINNCWHFKIYEHDKQLLTF